MTNKTSTGNRSTGYCSTGNDSTGNYSTGNRSTGNCSTGHYSTGNYSTGNRSTGNYSTGSWSISKYSTGHFSTEDYSGFGAFNKPCTPEEWSEARKPEFIYFDLTVWIPQEEMTALEKEIKPSYKITGGYLKVYDYQEAWRRAWDGATEEDKELLYALPNFDADVFKEISGIDVNEDITKELTIAEIEEQLGYKIKVVK